MWRTLHIESDYLTPSDPQSLWERTGKVRSVSPTKITADGPVLKDAEHAGAGNSGDNDPDIEQVVLGITTAAGAATNVTQPKVAVFFETLRDVAVASGYQAPDRLERVTAHEALCHGLYLGHRPGDIWQATYKDDALGGAMLADRVAALRVLNRPCVCPDLPLDCASYNCQ